jgi:hypothetical protein
VKSLENTGKPLDYLLKTNESGRLSDSQGKTIDHQGKSNDHQVRTND